jgi:hypothetical protein
MTEEGARKHNASQGEPSAPQAKIELKEGYLYDPVAQKQRKATDEVPRQARVCD